MVVAHEKGLADELDCVRTVAITNKPSETLMADNPLNKIPCLILDDGRELYDSRVISEYLDCRGGAPSLFPAGAKRWDALRRQALGDGLLDLLIAWRHERNRPERLRFQSYLDACRTKADASLDRCRTDTGGRTEFDIGDIAIGCALAYVDFRYPDLAWREGREKLADWYSGVAARESFLATPIIDDGDV